MKGYTPNLEIQNKTELNSKSQTTFIELGVKQCNEDCDCDKCKKVN